MVGVKFEKAKNTIEKKFTGRLQNFENILNDPSYRPIFFSRQAILL
jgi:hypothetical protein